MTKYAELLARAKRRIGRKNFQFDTDFLDEMKAAQERLEKGPQLPRWMKTVSAYATTAAGSISLTDLPPANYIRVYDDDGLTYLDTDGKEQRALRLDTYEQLRQKRNDPDSYDSSIYYFEISKTSFEIAPTQTRDVQFRMRYYAKQTVLTGANENDWVANEPDMILGAAGVHLATWLRDANAQAYFSGLFADARGQMLKQIAADEFSDVDLVMGDPD